MARLTRAERLARADAEYQRLAQFYLELGVGNWDLKAYTEAYDARGDPKT